MIEPNYPLGSSPLELKSAYMEVRKHIQSARLTGNSSMAESLGFYEELYNPDETLNSRITDYVNLSKNAKAQEKGNILEEVAFLAFRCLVGCTDISSFRAVDGQIDLAITINRAELAYDLLNLRGEKIILEAKNLKETVDVKAFSRLCGILAHKYKDQAFLGVFFSTHGASGFPKRTKKGKQSEGCLKDAKLIQVLFHFSTQKYIIVFDYDDILNLSKPGELIRLIQKKISDVEDQKIIIPEIDGNSEEHLPPHLARYRKVSAT